MFSEGPFLYLTLDPAPGYLQWALAAHAWKILLAAPLDFDPQSLSRSNDMQRKTLIAGTLCREFPYEFLSCPLAVTVLP